VARARSATDLFSWGSTTIFFVGTGALEHAVLVNRHVSLPACERTQVSSHRVDRRVLAVLEYLAQSGFSLGVDPSSCTSPSALLAAPAASALATPAPRLGTLDIAQINGQPVVAHPSSSSFTGLVLARLRALYGEFVPQSVLDIASATTLIPQPGGTAHELQVSFAVPGAHLAKALAPAQLAAERVPAFDAPLTTLEWSRVTARLSAISSPGLVPFPSPNATVDHRGRASR
jgi:hypothetical protein